MEKILPQDINKFLSDPVNAAKSILDGNRDRLLAEARSELMKQDLFVCWTGRPVVIGQPTGSSTPFEDMAENEPATIPMPMFATRPMTMNSKRLVDIPHNSMVGQQRQQISELQFDKLPYPQSFLMWKIQFKTQVTTCSDFPSEAMLWIKELEMVDSLDELKSSPRRWSITKNADLTTVCPESFRETRCIGHAGERVKCTKHSSPSKGKFEVSFIWRSENFGEPWCIVFIWAGKLDQEFCVQKR